MIILRSSDGDEIEVSEEAAIQSTKLRDLIGDNKWDGGVIPVSNVHSLILRLVIDYCNRHATPVADNDQIGKQMLLEWDNRFVEVSDPILINLIKAANDLKIKGLLDLTCQTATKKTSTMTTLQQIREFYDSARLFP